jgi:hypothetical protein
VTTDKGGTRVNLGIKVAESASRVSRVSELDLGAAWQEVQHLMPICIAVESGFGFPRANEEQAGSDRFVPGMWQPVQEARKGATIVLLEMECKCATWYWYPSKQPKIHRNNRVSLYSLLFA